MSIYLLHLRGPVDLDEINPMSPHQMTLVTADSAGTLFTICTDQSGLIGLLRHLHSLGFEFLSIQCQADHSPATLQRNKE